MPHIHCVYNLMICELEQCFFGQSTHNILFNTRNYCLVPNNISILTQLILDLYPAENMGGIWNYSSCFISLIMTHLVTSENSLHFFEMLCHQQTNWLTDWLTAWSIVLLEKPVVALQVKRFPIFYGTWNFITIFTRAHSPLVHVLSQMNPVHTFPTDFLSITFNIILSSI
jgi:hypothetical protein